MLAPQGPVRPNKKKHVFSKSDGIRKSALHMFFHVLVCVLQCLPFVSVFRVAGIGGATPTGSV